MRFYVIFNFVLLICLFRFSLGNALRLMPEKLTDDKSTLVQVMAWCRQTTSHYLSQCWPSSMSPYGVTRAQWVNQNSRHFQSGKCIWNVNCKMVAIRWWHFYIHFLEWQWLYVDENFTEVCSWVSNWSTLIQVMVWHQTGAKPIPKPMTTQFADAYMRHQAPVPLSIFRSNSKFDENSERSSFKYIRPITTIFCTRHESDTVVTCAKYHCDRPRIFYTRVFWILIEFRIRSKYA